MRVLVTGANGQLGRCISEVVVKSREFSHIRLYPHSRSQLDVTDKSQIYSVLNEIRPQVIINTAAYTDVEGAELNSELAFKINANGAFNLAVAACKIGARLIHVSTDYVFNGIYGQPLDELNPVDPINAYGRSKLLGEKLVRATCSNSLVVRSSGIYSKYGCNFVHKILYKLLNDEVVNVVADQWVSPCYGNDLAYALLNIAGNNVVEPGVYHYGGSQVINWHAFAFMVANEAYAHNRMVHMINIQAVSSAYYSGYAPRPSFSALDSSLLNSMGIASYKPAERLKGLIAFIFKNT